MDKTLVVLFVALSITACTIKNTSIRVPQTAEVGTSQVRETTVKIPDTGTVTITQTITVSDSAVKTETDQDADADIPVALGMPGSTPASSVGNVVQEGVSSSNTVPVVVTPPVIAPASEKQKPEVADPDEPLPPIVLSSFIGVSECKPYETKSACRIWVPGFNEKDIPVRFIFDNECGEFTIVSATEDFPIKTSDEYEREGRVYQKFEKGSPVVSTEKDCVATRVSYYKTVEK
jgi:hypothetical protein